MANGQQQQSVVTNQQQGVTQQQQGATQQQPNLYQTITSMNPQQMLELKGKIKTIQNTDEIRRNIGDVRALQMFKNIKAGKETMESAIEKSKTMMSPISREIDNTYFQEGMTADRFSELRIKHEAGWSNTDRNRFMTLWNSLRSREDAELRAEIASSKATSKRQKAINDVQQANTKYQLLGQNDYVNMIGNIDEIVNFTPEETEEEVIEMVEGVATVTGTRKVGGKPGKVKDVEQYNLALESLQQLITQDLKGNAKDITSQMKMNEYLNIIAMNVPDEFINDMDGYIIDGQFLPIPEKEMSPAKKRWYLAQQFQNTLVQARNHTAYILNEEQMNELVAVPASGYSEPDNQEGGVTEVQRKMSDGKIAIFDADTKQFIRYQEDE
tara:strand:- start:607 stop:1755 length:1149 start_codon:yes stop_codon:yes gene_type:complete